MGALLAAGWPAAASADSFGALPVLAMLQLTAKPAQEPAGERPLPLQLPDPGEDTKDDGNSLRLPDVAEGLPPLGEQLVTLSVTEGPDPLLARERSSRRSAADREPRGETVLERKRPLYDPLGIKAGSFTIFAS